ncbi:MAG: NAD(P)-binding protein [Dongiaceae bacterium]
MVNSFIGRQAVVVGAGISGLASAAALADYFEQVTVLERGELPAAPAQRTGTPQDKHLHGLLTGGLRALGMLLPGFAEEVQRIGGVALRMGMDIRYEMPGCDALPQRDFGLQSYGLSRPPLDFALRRRIGQLPNVILRQQCRVLEILAAPDGLSAAGVRYETAAGTGPTKEATLAADLVIDASSSGALTLAFLRAVGRPLPEETVIGVDIGYATALYTIPDDAAHDWKGVITLPKAPESGRAGYLMPQEGKHWILTVSGRHDDRPPGDAEGFLAFVQNLRTPTIYNAIKDARRQSEIIRFRFAESVWRHFDRLGPLPRGLLPIGDAICRFNPVYGQGMTVSAQEAHLLHDVLRARARDADPFAELSQSFLAGVQPLIASPWAISAMPDFVFPETTGERPANLEDALHFSAGLNKLALRDPDIHRLVMEVQHLLKPHSSLRDPALVERVKAELAKAA